MRCVASEMLSVVTWDASGKGWAWQLVTKTGASYTRQTHSHSLHQGLTASRPSYLTVWSADTQIYNESVFDLLRAEPAPLGGRPALRLKEDAQGRVFVDGAQEASSQAPDRSDQTFKSAPKQLMHWQACCSWSPD
jgi:hypothetical protein